MFPSYEEIKQLDGDYNLIPVASEIYADVITPITLLRKLAKIDKNFYLLESVEDGVRQGRYSFLGFNPLLRAVCKDYTVTINFRRIQNAKDSWHASIYRWTGRIFFL